VIELTDKVVDMAEDPVLQEATSECGENAGGVFEAVTLGVIRSGTSVAYSNGAARSAVASAITLNALRGAEAFLNVKKAKKVTKYVPSTVKTVSEPVRPAFVALCHSYHQQDLEQLAGWTPVERYGDAMGQLPYEIGKIGGVRFCASPDMPVWADAGGTKGAMRSTTGTNADVYPIIIFGDEAYATAGVKGTKDIELYIHTPDKVDSGNPLGQKGTVGWKSWFAAAILNQNWLCRIETAVTQY
jgi:N4-gp56 family major capsid protein